MGGPSTGQPTRLFAVRQEITIIIDMEGFQLSSVTPSMLQIFSKSYSVIQKHFPDREHLVVPWDVKSEKPDPSSRRSTNLPSFSRILAEKQLQTG